MESMGRLERVVIIISVVIIAVGIAYAGVVTIPGLTEETAPTSSDLVEIWDVSAAVGSRSKKLQLGNLHKGLDSTLADIADGTIAENLVNTANPWADNEVADNVKAGGAGAAWDWNSQIQSDTWEAITANDATPDVSGATFHQTANSGATTITDFVDSDGDHSEFTDGQFFWLWVNDANTTFDLDGEELAWASQGANNYAASQHDYFKWQFDSALDAGGAGWRVASGPMPKNVALLTLTLPQGTDPDGTTSGLIALDTDGGNETGDETVRIGDGANQFILGGKLKHFQFSITDPENIPTWTGRANPSGSIWENQTGFSFTIVKVRATSDTDNYDFTLFESASETDLSDDNDTSIIAIECDANGTECFTDEEVVAHVVEHGHHIIFEDTLGAAGWVKVVISGWFNGDVD